MNSHRPGPARIAPVVGHPASTAAMMGDVLVSLLPALGMATFMFGFRTLVLTAISVASCVGVEYLYRRLTHQQQTIGDLSACVTGLLLAMCLPASSSYFIPVVGSLFAILVIKQLYGGLGKNFMNPALGSRMLLSTFPMLMTTWPAPMQRLDLWQVDAVSAATPMAYPHEGTLPPHTLEQLLLGQQGGCLGEVSAFMLLLGGLYLIARRVISVRIPFAFLGTVALLTLLFPHGNGTPVDWMLAQLFSGSVMLGAFFLATDPVTSPVTPRGQLMFGVGCGALTVLLRYHGSYPEGVGWAILTMNCCVWLLDRAGMPRRYGESLFSATKNRLKEIREDIGQIKFIKPTLHISRNGKAPGEAYLDQMRACVKPLGFLVATVLVTGTLIAGVHYITELDTARAENRVKQEILTQAMPHAAFRSETPFQANGALSITAGYSEDHQLVGYCVEVQAHGFGGMITMVVGVDLDGKVTGVAITDHKETNGVGTDALSPLTLRRYIGKSGTIRPSGSNSVDTVSGATATSKALTAGVNRALAIVANLDTEGEELYYEDTE